MLQQMTSGNSVKRLVNFIPKLIDHSSIASGTLAGLAMFMVSVINTYEVIMRRFFFKPTTWVFTASLFVLMWFALMSTPMVIKDDRQIVADFLTSRLSKEKRSMLKILANFLSIVFFLIIGYYGSLMCIEAYQNNHMTLGLFDYPSWILYICFPLTTALILLQLFRSTVTEIRNKIGAHIDINPEMQFMQSDRKNITKGWLSENLLSTIFFLLPVLLGVYLFHTKPLAGLIVMALSLLLGGTPAAFSLGLTAIAGLFITQQGFSSLQIVPVIIDKTFDSFVLLAIPMFIMGGVILSKCGIGMRIYDLASKWLGSLPGGLAMATIIACAIVSAMIGVSTAVAAAIGLIAIPQLLSHGYKKGVAYGSVAGGALGILIPPSAGLIVYGYLTNSSVGLLFASAFLPAAMLVFFFIIYVFLISLKNDKIERLNYSWAEKFIALKKSILGLLAPVIVLGGIYSGLFTPTEAAGVLVIYSMIVAFIYKEMDFKKFISICRESATLGSAVMMIMMGAMILTNLVALLRVPRVISEWLIHSGISNLSTIIALMFMYVILGMFLDGLAITVLTVPVLFPIMPILGLDVISFGIALCIFVEMALITPPIGLNLFIIKAITGDEITPIARGNIPFAVIMFVAAVILLLFPQIAHWLPKILGIM